MGTSSRDHKAKGEDTSWPVNLYHDTMPKSPDGITWPHAPASTLIEWTDEMLDQIIEAGYMLWKP